ncbi:GntR family transcriptional regulator [Roseibium algae]|uniref:GntR family transcriptional regulator n=1 Tax=Roseibium algae TaxID=3123038 RepID=A0ABU8TI03_9HYPH
MKSYVGDLSDANPVDDCPAKVSPADAVMAEKSGSSDERVLMILRRMIMDGALSASDKITEVGIASLLNVSRTPVRLALRTLEVEGLICKREGRGYDVVSFDFDDVSKAYEVRGVLEGLAARSLAQRGLSDDVDEILRQALGFTQDALTRLGDKCESGVELYLKGNKLFHETIMQECGNSFVPFTYNRLESLPLLKLGTLVFNHKSHDTEVQRLTIGHGQHLIVYDAIRKGDTARAEAMMREHSQATVTYSMLFSR